MGAGFGVDTSGETGALLYLHLPTLELTVQQLSVVVYDCLFAHCNDVRGEPFIERQRRLHQWRLQKLKSQFRVKEQYLVDSVQPVQALLSARMAESSDGLIFARADRPYRSNDHTSVYKWKPPEHLSIDMLLQLRFPPVVDGPEDQPDFGAVPHFHLYVPNGGRLQFFDHLAVSAAVWEEWKASEEQMDDRVVEVTWDQRKESFQFLRMRDDRVEPNTLETVLAVLYVYEAQITANSLVSRLDSAISEWSLRQSRRSQ